ncbi:hypothetical protein [Ruegeria arenilitoris]|uniref:hypothetical protein n=1 Tax=Ruegeria arenilitoris TaxID=1173585 RepID=UPI00147BB64B|nr:hypothetical protein [Ruegeria arenilitoris]
MIKKYSGSFGPIGNENPVRVSFSIEWRCPICGSENVDISGQSFSNVCDGGPSTFDELSDWQCGDCGHTANGLETLENPFNHRVFDFEEHEETDFDTSQRK